jgi:phosphoadenosine phosphosulfate reductase
MQTLLSEPMVRELNARFETSHPTDILRWALLDSGLPRVAVASAFQAEGTAIIHMAARIRPDVPVLFLETGFHFAETLAFKQKLTDLLELNVVDLVGDHTVDSQEEEFGPRLYERDPHLCCELNKVAPWRRALLQLDGWITSMRRDSAWTRADTPIVDQQEIEPDKMVVKVNPMANWTRRDVWAYSSSSTFAQPAVRPRLRVHRLRALRGRLPGRRRARAAGRDPRRSSAASTCRGRSPAGRRRRGRPRPSGRPSQGES